MNKVFALVGMCGSGKSIANDFFKQRGFVSVYFGGITMEELQNRDMEVNPENEKLVREDLRKKHGMAAYAILSLPKIEWGLKTAHVIADGLYSWSEYKVLREKFGDKLVIVAVHASPKDRYERLAKRELRPLTQAEAKKRDYAEIENIEKAGPIAMADYMVVNNGSVNHLINQLESIVL